MCIFFTCIVLSMHALASNYTSYNWDFEGAKQSRDWQAINGNWNIQDGAYQQESLNEEAAHTLVGSSYWDNYTVEAKIRLDEGSWAGLVFRASSEYEYYVFYLSVADNKTEFWRHKKGDDFTARDALKNYIPPTGITINHEEWYQIRIDVNDDDFTLYINDIKQGVFQDLDRKYGNGGVGLWTWKTKASFDDVIVSKQRMPPPSFSRNLVKGLNLISLPLQPSQPTTAASLINQVGATMVIRLDEDKQTFVPYLPGISNDFAVQGAAGYIVNLKQSRQVTFTGTAWDNTVAAPSSSSSPTWAFVLGGAIDSFRSAQQVTLFNPRTGLTSTADVAEQSYSLAIADLNRRSVVEVGDRLEIRLGSERLYYRIQPNDLDRASARVDLKPIDFLPHQTRVLQNYPNPFNPETWIPFQLAEDGLVELEIFDLAGERIRSLDLGLVEAGKYLQPNRAIYWDGRSELGEWVSSGVYFYRLRTDQQTQNRKMVILK